MATRKIFWTSSERASINKALIEAFTDDAYLTRREALTRAQLSLPYERRRRITDQVAFHESAVIEAARNSARATPHAKPEPEPALVQETSLGELFEKLIAEVTRRVTAEVQAALADQLPGPVSNARERLAIAEPPPQRERKKSVLIIGLNGQQITIAKQHHSDLSIVCLSAEDALTRNLTRADHTILMTRFISHGVQCKYRHVPNLHYCNGGVSDLG